jgi:hypothetical protein
MLTGRQTSTLLDTFRHAYLLHVHDDDTRFGRGIPEKIAPPE